MKMLLLAILAAAGLFSLSNTAQANTFYVATSGADANSGSQAQPWRSLQHAVDSINPGDTILVESGTYSGCRIGHSGLAGAVCTLKADAGANVLVNSPGSANRHNSNIEVELFDDTVRYWVIDGLESAGSPHYGIDVRVTQFVTVQNCFVHGAAATGIFLAFCDHPLIQNNETAFNGEHGIYDSNSADYPTIAGNRSHHNHAAGIHMNGDRTITPGDGIISFALVERNIIYENGLGGGSGINCDGVSDSILRNNLLYNNHASGISLYAIDGAEGSSRNLVYNNTIVMAAGARWCINIPASDDGLPNPSGNKVKNNILYTPDAARGSVVTYSSSPAGFESDYNVAVGRFSIDGGDSRLALANWQALGFDLHSILGTPGDLFVDPAGNNYHLRAGSAAIGAGVAVPDVADDLDGVARPKGLPYSIGCYEAQQSLTNPVDYFPAAFSVEAGKVLSGDVSSLDAADGNYLRIKTARLDGQFGDIVTYEFDTGLSSVATIQIISISHPSAAPQRQQVSLFNVAANSWDLIDDRSLTVTGDSSTSIPVTMPARYLSAAGKVQVQIRTGDMAGPRWKHFIDLVKITAQ